MGLVIGADSHIGKRRARNEDRLFVQLTGDDTSDSSGAALLAVADGMGGGPGGEVASSVAVETLSKAFRGRLEGDTGLQLRRLFLEANAAVHPKAEASAKYWGMGTTLVAAAVHGIR